MSITRTAWTDDDGTGTTGTIINNSEKTSLYDQIDGRWSENTTTSTGNQDNFAYSEADVLRCNNATAVTFRGLLAPASPTKPGKTLRVYSVAAGGVTFNDQDTNSTAANRIITGAGAAVTVCPGGFAELVYDATVSGGRWRVTRTSSNRVTTITSSATPAINTDQCDAVTITALAAAITSMTSSLTGTPYNFQRLIVRMKDNGTARAITWGASFEAKGVALPTTTVLSKVLTVGFFYDTVTSKWGCVASAQEA